eukprot:9759291-Lingulodinium_polyedra.AAC.1
MTGAPFANGDVDVRNCFDQLVRPLVIALATAAGMPAKVLGAYARCVDGLSLRLCLASGLGRR